MRVEGTGGELTRAIDRVFGGVDVENKIDTGISQHLHTFVMILGVVDVVNADSVEAQFFEQGDISLAVIGFGEGISFIGGTTLWFISFCFIVQGKGYERAGNHYEDVG